MILALVLLLMQTQTRTPITATVKPPSPFYLGYRLYVNEARRDVSWQWLADGRLRFRSLNGTQDGIVLTAGTHRIRITIFDQFGERDVAAFEVTR